MQTKRHSRKEWITLLDEMSKSGLTQTQWCRQNNINYKTMRAMKDAIKKASGPDTSATDIIDKTKLRSGLAPNFVRVVAHKDITTPTPTM
ncbi:MAG: hypothetical protein LBK67_04050 [Coriobacteriales bacterium]|nr:hypothetical protein [Coriobacteriales bacterium]